MSISFELYNNIIRKILTVTLFYLVSNMILKVESNMPMTKPCIYCSVPVLITEEEETRLTKYGISVNMVRVSCSKCDDRKLRPMISEDG
jgi:hypothetical protein